MVFLLAVDLQEMAYNIENKNRNGKILLKWKLNFCAVVNLK